VLFDHEGAADLYGQAAAAVPDSAPAARWRYFYQQAGVVFDIGSNLDQPARVAEALAVMERAAPLAPRVERLRDWAAGQRRAAMITLRLGELRNEPAMYRQAAEMFREVAANVSRTEDVDNWMGAQIGIAQALTLVSRNAPDPAVRAEAGRAREAAASAMPPSPNRLWLVAQRELGDWMTDRERALGVYRAAVVHAGAESEQDVRRELNGRIALSLQALGIERGGPALLRESAEAHDLMAADTPRGGPVEARNWVQVTLMAGIHWMEYAKRAQGADRAAAVERALARYAAASQVATREPPFTVLWVAMQGLWADALLMRAEAGTGVGDLERAVAMLRGYLLMKTMPSDGEAWTGAQLKIATALERIAERGPAATRPARLAEARAAYAEVLGREGVTDDHRNQAQTAATRLSAATPGGAP